MCNTLAQLNVRAVPSVSGQGKRTPNEPRTAINVYIFGKSQFRVCVSLFRIASAFSAPQPVRKRYALAVVPVLPQYVTGVEVHHQERATLIYLYINVLSLFALLRFCKSYTITGGRKNRRTGAYNAVFDASTERKNAFCECHLHQLRQQKPHYRAL